MSTITRKNTRSRNKSPEITRLVKVMDVLGIKPIDIAKENEISERTITNFIWNDTPIGGQLLRILHVKYGVSIDWLLSGVGSMFVSDRVNEEPNGYNVIPSVNTRTKRMCSFIQQFMEPASPDEQSWLETQMRFSIPQYQVWLERQPHE